MDYGATDPYGTYQTKEDENPYEILLRLKSWQNQIRSTISKVNETIVGIHEQQTQILQNIDSIEINVLDIQSNASSMQTQISNILVEVGNIELEVSKHTVNLDLKTTEIANLQLTQSQITLNVANIDSRLGSAEASLIVNAQAIAQRVTLQDFTGAKISSLMVQDAYSFSWFAQQLALNGLVSFNALETNLGTTKIHGGNILTGTMLLDRLYGNLFAIGNGAGGTSLEMYAIQGNHRIRSYDANGFRIWAQSNLSFQSDFGTVYSNSKFWATAGFQVTGFSQLQDASVGTLTASTIILNGAGVVNVNSVQSMIFNATSGLTTKSYVDDGLRQKEIDIIAWVRANAVMKT